MKIRTVGAVSFHAYREGNRKTEGADDEADSRRRRRCRRHHVHEVTGVYLVP